MKKENHNEEIRATRTGGFGGSDAQLLLEIGDRLHKGLPLTTTMKRRIRIAKGIDKARPDFTTEDIERGRAFEDEVAARLAAAPGPGHMWDRETFITSPEVAPVNFRAFAHADFCDLQTMSVKEVKWSRVLTPDGLVQRYAAQLQWYYLLGAKSVTLVYHCEPGKDGGEALEGSVDVLPDRSVIANLKSVILALDIAWDTLDLTVTEYSEEETAPTVLEAIKSLMEATARKEEAEREVAALKEELAEAFRANEATRFYGSYGSISMIPARESMQFDSQAFAKAHPDLFAAFCTKLVRKQEYITCKFRN